MLPAVDPASSAVTDAELRPLEAPVVHRSIDVFMGAAVPESLAPPSPVPAGPRGPNAPPELAPPPPEALASSPPAAGPPSCERPSGPEKPWLLDPHAAARASAATIPAYALGLDCTLSGAIARFARISTTALCPQTHLISDPRLPAAPDCGAA